MSSPSTTEARRLAAIVDALPEPRRAALRARFAEADRRINAWHTSSGQGVGLKLVMRAVEDARASGKKIIPLCPFANAQFRRHSEWADVLDK